MVGINPILEQVEQATNGKGYITERELSKLLADAKLPRLLISAIYEELEKMNIRIIDKDTSIENIVTDESKEENSPLESRDTRLQERVQKYRNRNVELNTVDGRKIIDEFYLDLSKPRMQYSYFPLVFLAFFDRRRLTAFVNKKLSHLANKKVSQL